MPGLRPDLEPGRVQVEKFMSDYFEQHMNSLVPMVVEQTNRGERALRHLSRVS